MEKKAIKLGLSTDLTKGFNTAWLAGNTEETGLQASVKKPLEERELALPSQKGQWSYPAITLHENANELLEAIYPARIVNAASSEIEASFNRGELFTGHNFADAVEKFRGLTGIDLSLPNMGYALLKLTRKDATLTHASTAEGLLVHSNPLKPFANLGVDEEFRSALIRLRPCLDQNNSFSQRLLSTQVVNEYLQFFRTYGTHYVSAADVGDVIYQVFSYDKNNFSRIKTGFNASEWQGAAALEFAYYTTSTKNGKFGYSSNSSKIIAYSNDAALKQSILAKEWFEPVWAQADSIFSMFNKNSAVERSLLNGKFIQTTPISYTLSSLTVFAEIQRRAVWNRIFAGAMVLKFPASTKPNLTSHYDARLEQIFGGNTYTGLASSLATPNVNLYKPVIQASQLSFAGADGIQNLTISTNLFKAYAGDSFILPGKNVLISAQTVAAETTGKTITVTISDKNEQLEDLLYCEQFYGLLRFVKAKTNESYVVLDAVKLKVLGADNTDGKKGDVVAERDIRVAPAVTSLPKLKQSLQFSYTFLQTAVHNDLIKTDGIFEDFLDHGLKWIAKQIPSIATDSDLLNLRVMSLDMANTSKSGHGGTYVPILSADAYRDKVTSILDLLDTLDRDYKSVEAQIAARKIQEMVVDTTKTLNDNIKESGTALLDYIKASASSQKAMAGYYDAIAADQETQYRQMVINIELLKNKVDAQQTTVNYAIETYKEKVKSWITMTAISASFTLISDVFTAGGAAGEAIKEVDKLKQIIIKIKKVITLLAALGKAYLAVADAARQISNASEALDTIDQAGTLMLSQLEWDELLVTVTGILDSGPGEGAEGDAKGELLAEFKILVLRGKALLEAQMNANKLARDIFNNQKLKEILSQQESRLNEVNAEFKNIDSSRMDLTKIDLAGLTGNLDVLQNQMLSMLASTYALQEQSLRYQYLQSATPVNHFTLVGFKTALVEQKSATLLAKEKQSRYQENETTEISYLIQGIPINQIAKGGIYNVAIGLDAKEFLHYVNTRVVSVVASSRTKVITKSGEFLLNLRCIADPFMDRDTDRAPITYHSLSREKSYEYSSGSMTPLFDDHGKTWSEGVNPITPFTIWEISFPNSHLNEGISFEGSSVDIVLSFKLKARIKDTSKLLSNLGVQPTANEMVAQMAAQGTVTNNWDVVYNMSLSKINASLKKQYTALASRTSYFKLKTKIMVAEMDGLKMYINFDIDLGYPDLQFLSNNTSNASLTFKLSGKIQKSRKDGDEPERLGPELTLTSETFKAEIPISMVTGLVQPQAAASKVYSVILDLAAGSFTAAGIDLSDEGQAALNKIIKEHFIANRVQFMISSLDLSQIAVIDDLRPNEFLFKTLITPANVSILQLFIQTNSRKSLGTSQTFLNNLPEPLPASHSASLIINSKLFFNNILPKSIKGGWKLSGVDPAAASKPWNAAVSTGTISGRVDTSNLHSEVYDGTSEIYVNADKSNNIVVDTSGMKISPTASGILNLKFSKKKTVEFFDYIEYIVTNPSTGQGKKYHKTNAYTTDVNVSVNALLPVTVGGAGRDQTIQISVSNKEVNVDGRMSGGGPCGCADMESQVNAAIKNQIPAQMVSVTNISFDSLSVFALKNLLFPSDNFINLKSAQVPGDMLVLGEFIETTS